MAAALALALTVAAAAATPIARAAPQRAAARDWSAVTTRNAAGAFVVGNPAAKVKLVEYLSFTCSHCADFARDGLPALARSYVRQGTVSIEFRHALRDPADLVAALLARCGGPRGYAGRAEAVFAAQPQWLPRASTWFQLNGRLPAEPSGEDLAGLARGVGLDALLAPRGLAAGRIVPCLSDGAERRVLEGMAEEAWATRRIGGTPLFLIDGRAARGVTWAELEPQVKAALS